MKTISIGLGDFADCTGPKKHQKTQYIYAMNAGMWVHVCALRQAEESAGSQTRDHSRYKFNSSHNFVFSASVSVL